MAETAGHGQLESGWSKMLPDLIGPGLRIVFCGTAAGEKSAMLGAYYAGPGNQFWPVLDRIGLTPTRLAPREYDRLLEYEIGLTDVCKVSAGSDRAIGTKGRAYSLSRRPLEPPAESGTNGTGVS
jgi:G:T/U-mismatch repair DNA glycosylase